MRSVTIRAATGGDYASFARLFPFLGVDDPIPPAERWAKMLPDAFVADRDGVVIGYLTGQVLPHGGYVRNVVVDPASQGKGVGRALMLRFAEHVRAAGLREWELNVKPENVPAVALYTSLGMRRTHPSVSLRFDWTLVDALPDAPCTIEALGAEDDERVESALGVTPGVIARSREAGGKVILAAWRDGSPVGVAVFDPAFPGAFPFRVADPDVAGPLCRALRPHALQPVMQLTIEDDAVTRERFTSRGALVRMEIDHYRGPLPS
jgi:GNAT superfamily N-acetyltransferase